MRVGGLAAAVLAAGALIGCAQAYLPRFDGGVLNPDIRFLRAGDVMEGVKCAMTAYMDAREQKLLADRQSPEKRASLIRYEVKDPAKTEFHPYYLNAPKGTHDCPINSHWGCHRTEKGNDVWRCERKECIANRCDDALYAPHNDRRLGISLWDYSKKTPPDDPNIEKGCAPVPDYSRFALDDTQSASIELILKAVDQGSISLTQIDATKTFLFPFLQPGNRQIGQPFPMLSTTPTWRTTFDMTAVMPQSVHTYKQSIIAASYGLGKGQILPVSLVSPEFQLAARRFQNPFQVQFMFPEEVTVESVTTLERDLKSSLERTPFKGDFQDSFAKIEAALPTASPEQTSNFRVWLNAVKAYTSKVQTIEASLDKQRQAFPGLKPPAAFDSDLSLAKSKIRSLDGMLPLAAGVDRKDPLHVGSLLDNLQGWLNEVAAVGDAKKSAAPYLKKNHDLAQYIPTDLSAVAYPPGPAESSPAALLDSKIEPLRKADAALTADIQKKLDAFKAKANPRLIGSPQPYEARAMLDTLLDEQDELDKQAEGFKSSDLEQSTKKQVADAFAPAVLKLKQVLAQEKPYQRPAQLDEDFKQRCHVDLWSLDLENGARVDFLALRNLLENVVERQNEAIHSGIPEPTLDTLVLSSEFELVVDTSGAVQLVRFIPQIVAPTLDLRTDHTHTLKITLRGKKTKGQQGASRKLAESCEQRVRAGSEPSDPRAPSGFCKSDEGKIFESILEALEKNGSGASATQ